MLRALKILASTLFFSISIPVFADPVSSLLKDKNDPVVGNKNGKVTVVEFFDYQCSHCVHMSPVIQNIIKANDQVRVVFKEYPIRGSLSEYAARAALAANKQGKYAAFNHALMATRYTITESTINNIAKENGINITRFKKDMNSAAITKQLQANYDLGRELGLNGTPVFFVSKSNASNMDDINFIFGAVSQSELQSAIDKVSK